MNRSNRLLGVKEQLVIILPGERVNYRTNIGQHLIRGKVLQVEFHFSSFNLGDIQNVINQAEQMLAGKTWFFGERFGCADAYFYWTFRRGSAFGADLSRFANCTAHRARVEARASVKALFAHEEAVKAKF